MTETERVVQVHAKNAAVRMNLAVRDYLKGLQNLTQAEKNNIVYAAAQFYVFTLEQAMLKDKSHEG